MKYVIEVTSKVTLEIDADNEGKAVAEACETAWEYDPDEQNAVIVSREDGNEETTESPL